MAEVEEKHTAEVKELLATFLVEARAGNAAFAVMMAMLIHAYPVAAQEAGISSLYESLLLQSIQSNDPELLACLAEELLIGRRLAGDGRMAYRAAEKADKISGFMGSYIIGRAAVRSKPSYALKKFAFAARAGHFPSRVWAHRLVAQESVAIVAQLLRWSFNVLDFCAAMRIAVTNERRRMWRGTDVFGHKELFIEIFGPDRQLPFTCIDAVLPAVRL